MILMSIISESISKIVHTDLRNPIED